MAKYSLKGYSFKTWAIKNKRDLKLIASGAFGLIITFVSNLDPKWSVSLGILVTTGSKMALDALDYWLAENPK